MMITQEQIHRALLAHNIPFKVEDGKIKTTSNEPLMKIVLNLPIGSKVVRISYSTGFVCFGSVHTIVRKGDHDISVKGSTEGYNSYRFIPYSWVMPSKAHFPKWW